MKNVLLLLLVVGIPVAAWLNRGRIMALVTPLAPGGEVTSNGAAPGLTPHPAKEARLAATNAYPALAVPNSPFNKKFLALYAEAQQREPELLARADWPLQLADRTAVALGGARMPVPGTPEPVRPSGLQGSALDKRPKK
jgi:hypothetical protein